MTTAQIILTSIFIIAILMLVLFIGEKIIDMRKDKSD